MAAVVGYLRHYRRWNETPGLTLAEQRTLVHQLTDALNFGRERSFLIEKADGEANDWPILHKAIQRAHVDGHLGLLVVIPTLDGVRFNLSFLELLVGSGFGDGAPIYVRSGWRRPKEFRTNTRGRAEGPAWLLSLPAEAQAFDEKVERVRRRAHALRKSVRAGLQAAADRGIKLGAQRPGSHRFTESERSKGGQATAQKRRLLADKRYEKWIVDILTWRIEGATFGQIATWLAARGAVKPDGKRIGPMLVYRILRRARSGFT